MSPPPNDSPQSNSQITEQVIPDQLAVLVSVDGVQDVLLDELRVQRVDVLLLEGRLRALGGRGGGEHHDVSAGGVLWRAERPRAGLLRAVLRCALIVHQTVAGVRF